MRDAKACCVLAAIAAALGIATTAHAAGTQTNWTLVDVGTLGGPGSYAAAMNNQGVVVGCADLPGAGTHAFVYQSGAMKDLGTGSESTDGNSCALAVNDAGIIAGRASTRELVEWSGGALVHLRVTGNVTGINSEGVVVGAMDVGSATRAFMYRGGTVMDLGDLGTNASASSSANAINGRGQIVGNSNNHAFLYEDGAMRDLGTLGGSASIAKGIDSLGDIVGMAGNASGTPTPFVYDGTMHALPAPTYSAAIAINGHGQVIGSGEGIYGYLLDNGVVTRLDTIPAVQAKGWRHLEPTAINDLGWIVGYAMTPSGDLRAFLLMPSSSSNVALVSNGATAIASSQFNANYPVGALINGDATGAGWSNGGGWADGTAGQYPDWVEVDFAQASQIDHVVVYTLQDNWQNPSQPTDTMTFTQYGVTAFDVQAWNGSAWQTVGSVTGNSLVKRTVNFPALTTSRIRVVVNGALNSLSRITEIEAWTGSGTTASASNLALASAGATAAASSEYGSAYPVSAIINGDASGAGWSQGGGWADGTYAQSPDWAQVTLASPATLTKVVVYTLQDNWQSPLQPTDTLTFSQYGITDFDVQGWDGSQWVTLGSVRGNNLVKRTVIFNAFTTSDVRIVVTGTLDGYARITEVEAWGTPASSAAPGTNWALASNGGVASASSQYDASYPASAVIDGERKGAHWSAGGGWADATVNQYPDWVEIDFNGTKAINTVNVFTVQDDWQNPAEPADGMTFTQYGATDFTVQAWDGSQWQVVATVTGNNRVKRSIPVSVATSRIRINVTGSLNGLSRITEVEAWGS